MRWIKWSIYGLLVLLLVLVSLTYHDSKNILILLVILLGALNVMKDYYKEKQLTQELKELSDWIRLLVTEEIEKMPLEDVMLHKIKSQIHMLSHCLSAHKIEALKESQRLEGLISDIAHQLRTPLTNIKLTIDLMDEKIDIYDLRKQVERLEWLVEALVKLSRIESGCIKLNMREKDLNETIFSALGMIHRTAEKKNIFIDYSPISYRVLHDSKWTSEAIFNVLENAVKYSPDQGTIYLTVSRGEMYTKLSIIDEGIGMSEDDLNKIFKRFYRSERVHDFPGVGIGLYLSQEIMMRQKGYIYATSNSKGSCFEMNIRN